MIASDPAVCWELPTEWRSSLLNSDGQFRLNEWLSNRSATIVKQAPHRVIYRIRIPQLDFYLKEYKAVGMRGRLRELIRPIKARAEFEKANHLLELGIAVPPAIGWGFMGPRWSPSASFLLSETVQNAVPLTEYLKQRLNVDERQTIAKSLGLFVARLHAAGAIHRDFHPANLLFREDSAGTPEFFLIDLHEVRLSNKSSWRNRRENLVTLNRWFILRTSRPDRLRFWRAYESSVSLPDLPIARPADIEISTVKSNARFWITREKRFGQSSRHVKSFDLKSRFGLSINNLNDELVTLFKDNPDQCLHRHDARILKDGGASTVASINVYGSSMILKRFNIRYWRDPIKNGLRKSAALRSWLFGHGLSDAGLPTARPLALMHRRQFGMPATGYLLTEELPNVVDLRAFADRIVELPDAARQQMLRDRIETVGRCLREFHLRHFGNRDLKAANLLTPTAGHDHRVWFVDLVGVQWRRCVGQKPRTRDLSRLLASFFNHPVLTRSDKLRFLRSYLNWNLHGKTGWKCWWRELSELAQAKVARNQRIGRPLT